MPKQEMSDLEFMKTPMKWPHLILPLKRVKDGQLECAVLVEGAPRVYLADMYSVTPNTEIKEYMDYEGIVDDGWRVD